MSSANGGKAIQTGESTLSGPGSFDLNKLLLNAIYPLGVICLLCPSFAGVSIGLAKASQGICQAAAIKNDIVLTVIPSAFISVSILYAGLMFFLSKIIVEPTSYHVPLIWLSAQIITGIGIFWGSVSLGNISSIATITAAQQKRFKTSFFLLLVFGEFTGLFSLIIGVILAMENGVWNTQK